MLCYSCGSRNTGWVCAVGIDAKLKGFREGEHTYMLRGRGVTSTRLTLSDETYAIIIRKKIDDEEFHFSSYISTGCRGRSHLEQQQDLPELCPASAQDRE